MTDLITRLRAARSSYTDSPLLGHILHDAEAEIEERRAEGRRLRAEITKLRAELEKMAASSRETEA